MGKNTAMQCLAYHQQTLIAGLVLVQPGDNNNVSPSMVRDARISLDDLDVFLTTGDHGSGSRSQLDRCQGRLYLHMFLTSKKANVPLAKL